MYVYVILFINASPPASPCDAPVKLCDIYVFTHAYTNWCTLKKIARRSSAARQLSSHCNICAFTYPSRNLGKFMYLFFKSHFATLCLSA